LWHKCSFSDTFKGKWLEQHYSVNRKQLLKQTNFCFSCRISFSALNSFRLLEVILHRLSLYLLSTAKFFSV
jgi:hypothetical protein